MNGATVLSLPIMMQHRLRLAHRTSAARGSMPSAGEKERPVHPATVWRAAVAIGKAWRVYRSELPEDVRTHVMRALLSFRRCLMQTAEPGVEEEAQLREVLAIIAGRPPAEERGRWGGSGGPKVV